MKRSKIDSAVESLLSESGEIGCPVSYKNQTVDVKRDYVQYIQSDNSFTPVGEIQLVERLQPFVYNVGLSGGGIPVFTKVKPLTDELYLFEGSRMHSVLAEVKKFWSLKDNFTKLGFLHNRGILLYGPPGTGKTCLVQQVAESMVDQGDTLFFSKNVYAAQAGLQAFRQVEPERKAVMVLEDLDEYIGYQERDLLQLLDGANSVDNILYVGTTNYIEKFPPRLLRPGRFDKKILIDFPPVEGRLTYLNHKLKGIEEDEKIKDLANRTAGFSFGHLRELVIAGYAFQENIDEVVRRLSGINYTELPVREKGVVDSLLNEAVNRCGGLQNVRK